MIYIYLLSIILSGVGLAWYGPKKYDLSFAISYLATAMIFYFISFYPYPNFPYLSYVLIFNLVVALGILLFSKFFAYLIAWEIIAAPMLLVAMKITGGGSNPLLGLVVLIVPIVIVYYFRKEVKKISIGIFSGLSVGIGIASIFFVNAIENGKILSATPTFFLILLAVSIVGGIYFQYSEFNTKRLTESK